MTNYIISVSAGTGCYWHIEIPETATLADLNQAILSAIGFADEAPCAFYLDNRASGQAADLQASLDSLSLNPGGKFKYVYDTKDPLIFQCKLNRITNDINSTPKTIKSAGYPPVQHVDYDNDYDDLYYPIMYPENQLKRLYKRTGINQQLRKQLKEYLKAVGRFYGNIPLPVIYEILNEKISITRETFLAYMNISRHEDQSFVIINLVDKDQSDLLKLNLVNVWLVFSEDDALSKICQFQAGIDWYIPDGDKLLKYNIEGYTEDTKYRKALYTFFRDRFGMSKERADYFIYQIQEEIRFEADGLDFMFDYLEKHTVQLQDFTEGEIRELTGLYADFSNHTRLPRNCGYTPDEIRKMYPEDSHQSLKLTDEILEMLRNGEISPAKVRDLINSIDFTEDSIRQKLLNQIPQFAVVSGTKKVGRNEPCPCGSGKKYKNCCGRPKVRK